MGGRGGGDGGQWGGGGRAGGRAANLLAVVGFKQVGLQSGRNTSVDRKCLISRGTEFQTNGGGW